MIRLRSAAVLLCAAVLSACGEDAVQDITAPATGARVKFFNFAVNAPNVNFYANDTKVTAITSATGTESTVGVAFGSAGSGGFYSALAPGQYTFSGRISAATDKNLPVATAAASVEDGKAYSFYTSGFYDAATKKADAFVVEDVFPAAADYEASHIRFVNASSNSQPMVLFFRNQANGGVGQVGAAVAYKGGSAFVRFTGSGVVDLFTRAPGGTTDLVTRTGVSILAGRVYTVTLRGDMTVTSTTAANRPFLDLTANR
ncbi:MAG: DUF4397 domain-containing protein [Gemmatirosa sp.]